LTQATPRASPLGGVGGGDNRSARRRCSFRRKREAISEGFSCLLICVQLNRNRSSTIGVLSDDEGFDYSGDLLLLASRKL
jgi:hypothetical protein